MAFVKSGTGFSSRDPSKARETVCGFLSRAGSSSGGINVPGVGFRRSGGGSSGGRGLSAKQAEVRLAQQRELARLEKERVLKETEEKAIQEKADRQREAKKSAERQQAIKLDKELSAKKSLEKIRQEAIKRRQTTGQIIAQGKSNELMKIQKSVAPIEGKKLVMFSNELGKKRRTNVRKRIIREIGFNRFENEIKVEEKKLQKNIELFANRRQTFYQGQVNAGDITVDQANNNLQKDIDTEFKKSMEKNEFLRNENPRRFTSNNLSYQYESDRLSALKSGDQKTADISLFLGITAEAPSSLAKLGISAKKGISALMNNPAAREQSMITLKKIFSKETAKTLPTTAKVQAVKLKNFVLTSPTTAIAVIAGNIIGFGLVSRAGRPVLRATGVLSKKVSRDVLKNLRFKPLVRAGLEDIGKISVEISPTISKTALRATKTTKGLSTISSNVAKVSKSIKKSFSKSKFQKLSPRGIKLRASKLKRKIKGSKPVSTVLSKRKKIKTSQKRQITKAKKIFPKGRKIGGIKVPKREFKSFKEAERTFNNFKGLRKFINNVKAGKAVGSTERISKGLLSSSEIRLLSGLKGIPRGLLKDIKKIDVTVLSNKLKFNVPVIRRFKVGKKGEKGLWRFVMQEKELFQNTVSYGLINAKGKVLGSVSFGTISKKPLVNMATGKLSSRFRNVANAIKYGKDKSIIFSKQHGKQYVRSLSKSLDKRVKPRLDEFVSKFKSKKIKYPIQNIGEITLGKVRITGLITKKVSKAKRFKSVKKKFKTGQEVTREILVERKIPKGKGHGKAKMTRKGIILGDVPKGRTKLISIKKLERATPDVTLDKLERLLDSKFKLPKTKNIQQLEKEIKVLEKRKQLISQSFKRKSFGKIANRKKIFSNAQKRIGSLERSQANLRIKIINEEIKIGTRKLQFMKPLKQTKIITASPRQKLKLLESILKKKKASARQITTKQARSASSIPKKIRFKKRIDGIRELKKIRKTKQAVKRKLLKRGLSISRRASLLASIKVLDKLSKKLTRTISKSEFGKLREQTHESAKVIKKIKTTIKPKIVVRPITIPRQPRGRVKQLIIQPKIKKPIVAWRLPTPIKKTRRLSKAVDGYSIQIKKRGKYVKMPAPLLKLSDAKDVLAYNIDQTLARSAKIVPEGKTKIIALLKPGVKQTFKRNRKKFRGFKIRKGKKKQLVRRYIERKKYFHDTPLEKAQTRIIKRKRKITTQQKKILVARLEKARAVRTKNLNKRV